MLVRLVLEIRLEVKWKGLVLLMEAARSFTRYRAADCLRASLKVS